MYVIPFFTLRQLYIFKLNGIHHSNTYRNSYTDNNNYNYVYERAFLLHISHFYAFHVRIFLRLLVSSDCVNVSFICTYSVSFDIRKSFNLKNMNGAVFNFACYDIVEYGTTFHY